MRYWLSIGDGTTYGPFTVEELHQLATEGRLTVSAQLCEESSADWMPAHAVLPDLPRVPAAPPTSPQGVPSFAPPIGRQISLVPSIIVTVLSLLFCCLPIGVVPLLIAAKANTCFMQGDLGGGESAERNYKIWMTVCWVLMGISLLFTILSLFLGAIPFMV